MSKNYLSEAFKEMELLESDSFSFNKTGAAELGNFMEDDTLDDFETVIDPEALTEDELQDSYIGMGILACDVCHSMIYKAIEEIAIDEESQLANVGQLCPYCFNGDGFKIVGKVAPFEDITVETDSDDVNVKVDGKDVEVSPAEVDEMKVEEEIESEQKFPVQSPIGEVREDLQKAPRKRWTRVTEEVNNSENELTEGMEDISITTDDTVIKVKATPREDKETIVPVEPAEVEAAAPVEELPAEEGEESEMTDVDIEEIDEQGFDELGESYLKKVYENVQSYKTVSGSLRGNKIKLEGLITFNSGKKAKTNFIFEAKEMTKKGKLKFIGENVNLTNNKRAFTLTGRAEGKKLICENFNYNYLAKDAKSGNSKRLYGTIKK